MFPSPAMKPILDLRSGLFHTSNMKGDCGELSLHFQLLWIALVLYFTFKVSVPLLRPRQAPDGLFSKSDTFVVGSFVL